MLKAATREELFAEVARAEEMLLATGPKWTPSSL